MRVVKLGEHIEQCISGDIVPVNSIIYSVTNNRGFVKSEEQFSKVVYSKDISNYKLVKPGWFAFNPSRINVGSIDYLNEKDCGYVSPLYIVFKTKDILDNSYLKYFLKSPIGKKQIKINTKGSVRDSLSFNGLSRIQIPLPPLEIQKKIAAILDKADELRQNDKKILEKYDQLAQSVFLEMFGDPFKNTRNWNELKLSEIVYDDKIITYGIVQAGPDCPNGVPYIRTGDIKDGLIKEKGLLRTSHDIAKSYERSKCCSGDIIISIRASVGTVAILPKSLDGSNLTQGTARISVNPKIANPLYIFHAIKCDGIQRKINIQTKGVTFKEITLEKLRGIIVPIPPLEIQNHFAEILSKINTHKEISKLSLDKSKELFQSLLQRAFRGEL